jgi:RluA family pseudouridine synthase
MNRNPSIRICAEDAGECVLDYLTRRFTYQSRSRWEALIGNGKIRLNGRASDAATLMKAADVLSYEVVDEAEPPVSTRYDILYEDNMLLAINKSGNLPCHPAGRYYQHTLWYFLRTRLNADAGSLHFVNRLDRETSGIVLIAKTLEAANACRRQFEFGVVQKQYHVAVYGHFPEDVISADGLLCRDDKSSVRKKQRFIPGKGPCVGADDAKHCRTDFRLVTQNRGLSLLAASPVTGRMHQIRATLFSLGFPVVGDKLYGPDDTIFLRFIEDQLTVADKKGLLLSRQALHAYRLQLVHPVSGTLLEWTAPLPEDIGNLFEVIPAVQ